jgi:hypothetical protein
VDESANHALVHVLAWAFVVAGCLDTPRSSTVVDRDTQSVRFKGDAPHRIEVGGPAIDIVVQVLEKVAAGTRSARPR